MKINWKLVGVLTTIVGGALSLVDYYVEDKRLEEKIDEVLDARKEEEEEES